MSARLTLRDGACIYGEPAYSTAALAMHLHSFAPERPHDVGLDPVRGDRVRVLCMYRYSSPQVHVALKIDTRSKNKTKKWAHKKQNGKITTLHDANGCCVPQQARHSGSSVIILVYISYCNQILWYSSIPLRV